MIAQELGAVICGLLIIIPNIRKVISLVIDTTYDLQESECCVNLKSVSSSSDCLYQTLSCVNTLTKEFHTEDNSTYTVVIKNPNQEINRAKSI